MVSSALARDLFDSAEAVMTDSAAGLRVVVADDAPLIRDALVTILGGHGIEVVAAVGDAVSVVEEVLAHRPDCVVMDIRMPPGNDRDGIDAALRIWAEDSEIGVLLLSQYVELAYLNSALASRSRGFGYLLKERVQGAEDFVEAVGRVAAGGIALDPEIVTAAMIPVQPDPLVSLSGREREVIGLLAQGYSNRGIAQRLFLGERTVEGYVSRVMTLLGLPDGDDVNRRVLAVLRYLDVLDS